MSIENIFFDRLNSSVLYGIDTLYRSIDDLEFFYKIKQNLDAREIIHEYKKEISIYYEEFVRKIYSRSEKTFKEINFFKNSVHLKKKSTHLSKKINFLDKENSEKIPVGDLLSSKHGVNQKMMYELFKKNIFSEAFTYSTSLRNSSKKRMSLHVDLKKFKTLLEKDTVEFDLLKKEKILMKM